MLLAICTTQVKKKKRVKKRKKKIIMSRSGFEPGPSEYVSSKNKAQTSLKEVYIPSLW